MRNVHRRLQGIFGAEYGLTVRTPVEGGTRVEMRVPRRAPRGAFALVGADGSLRSAARVRASPVDIEETRPRTRAVGGPRPCAH